MLLNLNNEKYYCMVFGEHCLRFKGDENYIKMVENVIGKAVDNCVQIKTITVEAKPNFKMKYPTKGKIVFYELDRNNLYNNFFGFEIILKEITEEEYVENNLL